MVYVECITLFINQLVNLSLIYTNICLFCEILSYLVNNFFFNNTNLSLANCYNWVCQNIIFYTSRIIRCVVIMWFILNSSILLAFLKALNFDAKEYPKDLFP